MKTSALIAGLQILQKYRKEDGYDISAEHDIFYAHATDRPLSPEDVQAMIDLGWFQEDADTDGDDFEVKHYAPKENWSAFT